MSDENQLSRGEAELKFFGKITASVTHEINNVIAIIREMNGLLADLLKMAGDSGEIDMQKFNKVTGNIEKQTVRGETIVKRLNRFAHSVDNPRILFEPDDVLGNLANLCLRLADQRNVSLDLSIPYCSFNLHGNPFFFQQVIFSCLEAILSGIPEGEVISIILDRFENGAVVKLASPPINKNEDYDAKINNASRLMNDAGNKIEINDQGDIVIQLFFHNLKDDPA